MSKLTDKAKRYYNANYADRPEVEKIYHVIDKMKDGPWKDSIVQYVIHVEEVLEKALTASVHAELRGIVSGKIFMHTAEKLEEQIERLKKATE